MFHAKSGERVTWTANFRGGGNIPTRFDGPCYWAIAFSRGYEYAKDNTRNMSTVLVCASVSTFEWYVATNGAQYISLPTFPIKRAFMCLWMTLMTVRSDVRSRWYGIFDRQSRTSHKANSPMTLFSRYCLADASSPELLHRHRWFSFGARFKFESRYENK